MKTKTKHAMKPINWEKVNWDQPDTTIAKKLHTGLVNVKCARVRLGKPAYSKVKWDKIDWTKTDSLIASEEGVSTTNVFLHRKILGKPKGYKGAKRIQLGTMVKQGVITPDWKKTDTNIARELGVTREYVRQLRMLCGKTPSVRKKAVTLCKEDKELTAKEVAIKYGIIPAYALQLAKEQGVKLKRPKAWSRWEGTDWSKRNCDLAREHGVSPMSVCIARRRHAPHTMRGYK